MFLEIIYSLVFALSRQINKSINLLCASNTEFVKHKFKEA